MDDFNGILLVDKPEGPTSHDVVDAVRRRFGLKKVGHAGTLDPAASGLLILLIGASTKESSLFSGEDKTYEGVMTLGLSTETGDREGKIVRQLSVEPIPAEKIRQVFQQFEGKQEQIPPLYSAIKVGGRRLYSLARKGLSVERKARPITIRRLDVREIRFPEIHFTVECSKGTYVRSLVEDIGKSLGCPATLSTLRRTASGRFRIEEAIPLSRLLALDTIGTVLAPATKLSPMERERDTFPIDARTVPDS